MDKMGLLYLDAKQQITETELEETLSKNSSILEKIYQGIEEYDDSLGWIDIDEWANEEIVNQLIAKAEKIREDADVFVVLGVGGSNQAARAVIRAFQGDKKPKILFSGNNISAHSMNELLKKLEGKSVYINVIAKNFETLEPGIAFRVLRNYLYDQYGEAAKDRITLTGTRESSLHEIAKKHGYDFLIFPENVGGRYSVFTDVGLLPMAVSGVDVKGLVQGARDMQTRLYAENNTDNLALRYATYRNLLLQKGYQIEMLSFFEEQFYYLSKWWIQLFAESEGKDGKGIFPVSGNYSEDLHSVGQYVQEGQRIIFETFLDVEEQNSSIVVDKDHISDNFDYLNGKDFWDINKAAFQATMEAHSDSGIPCLKITIPKLDEYNLGQLFYMNEFSVYISGLILGINPFDQPGVENYKGYMFKKLGK